MKEVAVALSSISEDEIIQRYNPATLKKEKIYADMWDSEDAIGYIMENYRDLVKYYKDAAENNNAMLIYHS